MKVLSWVGGVCLAVSLLAPVSAAAQGGGSRSTAAKDSPEAKAASYLKGGAKAAAVGEWDDAYAEYKLAWSMNPSWEAAAGRGKAAYKTKRYAESIDMLAYYLREAPAAKVSAKQRAEAEAWLKDARSKTGILVITGPEGGDVLLDDEQIGKTPIADGIPVDPGDHKVEVRFGSTGETKMTPITAGAKVTLDFTPKKAGPGKTVIVKEEGVFTPQVRTAAVIGGGALAVGGIVAGGVMLGVSFAKTDEKREAEANPYGRETAMSAAQAASEAKSAALWCFVGGGAAALGTGAFYFFTRPRVKAPVNAGVVVGPEGPSIWASGHF